MRRSSSRPPDAGASRSQDVVASRTSSVVASIVPLAIVLVAALAVVGSARAHEEYVTDEEGNVDPAAFFADALSDPLVVGALAGGALAVGVGLLAYLWFRPAQRDLGAFRLAMDEYEQFVPWLLRISFGIPLVGAGFSGYFISPAVEVELRLLQVTLGFLLLFGLATRVAALATLAVYLAGAFVRPELLLQLEFVGGTAALVLVGSGKPSADHVLQRIAGGPGTIYGRIDRVHGLVQSFQTRVEPSESYLPTVARLGLGLSFVYLGAFQKLLRPGLPLAVVERYELTGVIPVPPELWVIGAGLTETALGLALLAGAFTRGVAFASIAMFTLTLFALPDDPVLAHVSLFGLASVLLITGAGPLSVDNRMEAVETELEETAPTA